MNLDYSKINKITINKPLELDCGITLDKFDIAYETYGKLDESKSNAIIDNVDDQSVLTHAELQPKRGHE